jgi:hypothetical protein
MGLAAGGLGREGEHGGLAVGLLGLLRLGRHGRLEGCGRGLRGRRHRGRIVLGGRLHRLLLHRLLGLLLLRGSGLDRSCTGKRLRDRGHRGGDLRLRLPLETGRRRRRSTGVAPREGRLGHLLETVT